MGSPRRGKLTVFLGYAPGVGKTVAMLEAAAGAKSAGRDVVVGIVEDHGRAHTAALAQGFETLPRAQVPYQGRTFEELDAEAVLTRAPELVVIDELAHTNVPGSGDREKRWEDVAAILTAGIDVFTTVNIQHLESLGDVVGSIIGRVQHERVPDPFLRTADEVELVDISPVALRARLSEGNIYAAAKVDAAMSNYFRLGNLTALRELALLWLADRVDEGLEEYRDAKGIRDTWAARDRIIVAVTGGAESITLIRRGLRIAGRVAGRELLVVHVVEPDGTRSATAPDLMRARELAEANNATWHTVVGDDVATALVEFARTVNASQIVLGVSRTPWYGRIFSPGVANRVIASAADIDVHMVTHSQAACVWRPRRETRPGSAISKLRRILGWVIGALAPLALTVLFIALGPGAVSLSINFLSYITVVVIVALIGGLWPAVMTAVLGTALINWFFTHPVGSFTIAEFENILALAIFIAVAVAVATVVDLAARRSRQAQAAEHEGSVLSELARSMIAEGDSPESMVESIRTTFVLDGVAVLSKDEAKEWAVTASAGEPVTTRAEATETFDLDDDTALLLKGQPLSAGEQRILDAYAGRLLRVLTESELAATRSQARELSAGNAVRTALLTAVSHDLRTPLGAIKAATSTLMLDGIELSDADERLMLTTIENGTLRLEKLIDNLLDMSRIQSGAVTISTSPVPVSDLVVSALAEVGAENVRTVTAGERGDGGDAEGAAAEAVVGPAGGAAASVGNADRSSSRTVSGRGAADGYGPEITVDIDPDAWVDVDFGLLERVLVNIVENSLKYGDGAPLTIDASTGAEAVYLRIADSGPGVSDDALETIFTPFTRLDESNAKGLGLGMAVALGLCRAMGIDLSAEHTPGGGFTAVLTFPRCRKDDDATSADEPGGEDDEFIGAAAGTASADEPGGEDDELIGAAAGTASAGDDDSVRADVGEKATDDVATTTEDDRLQAGEGRR
ncbi:Sensor protein kdpD [Mycobacteroides abscessus subsp. abscessus]|nr:Sensor protein kdpD [Mycobacteroides abscessus subsp. abscessus]